MRVIVVGAGINGLCAAWGLVRAGHQVIVLDRAVIPNRAGTSYDQHRLTRIPYGSQAGYCRMMADAAAAWQLLWQDLGAVHYVRTGCLALCTTPGDWTDRSAATLDALGIAWERLEGADLAARAPTLIIGDVRYGLHMREGGVLFADSIVDALTGWLARRGVVLRGEVDVAAVEPDAAAILTTTGERLSADALLITAGAWTAGLMPELTETLVPLRQVVAYVAPPPTLAQAWAEAPIMMDLGGPRGMYLAPPVAGRGFKIGVGALNRPSATGGPAPPTAGEAEALLECYRDRFARWHEMRVVGARVCLYANEPEQRFVLRRVGRSWVLTGCSGHGFKFGALMGLALTDAANGQHDPIRLAAWAAGDDPTLAIAGLAVSNALHAATPKQNVA